MLVCFQSAGLHPDRDLHPGADDRLLAALHLPVPRPAQHLGPGDQGGDQLVLLNQVKRSNMHHMVSEAREHHM